MYAALVLLGITLVVNIVGAVIISALACHATRDAMTWRSAMAVDTGRPIPSPSRFLAARALAAAAATLIDFLLNVRGDGDDAALSLVPLFSVVLMLVWRGGQRLSLAVFTQLPPAPLEQGGGFGNAIVGTLIIVALAVLVSRAGRHADRDLSRADAGEPACQRGALLREGADRLSVDSRRRVRLRRGRADDRRLFGVAGAVGAVDSHAADDHPRPPRTPSDGAGADEGAAIGMGATSTQIVWMVLLPTAHARHPDRRHAGGRARRRRNRAAAVHGALQQLLAWSRGHVNLMQPTASLAVLIYNFAGMPFDNQVELAWAAALVLVLLVLATNLIGQSSVARTRDHQS